jgi:hypothetical protein
MISPFPLKFIRVVGLLGLLFGFCGFCIGFIFVPILRVLAGLFLSWVFFGSLVGLPM